MHCCAVLYYAMLCCAMLCYDVLCSAMHCCAMLWCAMLCCAVLLAETVTVHLLIYMWRPAYPSGLFLTFRFLLYSSSSAVIIWLLWCRPMHPSIRPRRPPLQTVRTVKLNSTFISIVFFFFFFIFFSSSLTISSSYTCVDWLLISSCRSYPSSTSSWLMDLNWCWLALPWYTTLHSNLFNLFCSIPFHSTFLHFTPLYCTVLYCTVLYCTILYCTILYYTVLYCTLIYTFTLRSLNVGDVCCG